MALKIVRLYKDIPEMLESIEKRKLRKTALIDLLIDKLKKEDKENRNYVIDAGVAVIANYLDIENADSHSTRLSSYQISDFKIEDKLKELFEVCSPFLPKDLTVYVSLGNPRHKHLKKIRGVSGVVPYRRTVMLFIWPQHGWHQRVLEVFVHELAHVSRQEKIKGNVNLLEYIISEGLGFSLVQEIIGTPNKFRVPSETKVWNTYKNNLEITNKKKIHRLVFGDGKRMPLMAGYFMGYRIVQNYLAKTGKKASEALHVSAKEILNSSDYAKK